MNPRSPKLRSLAAPAAGFQVGQRRPAAEQPEDSAADQAPSLQLTHSTSACLAERSLDSIDCVTTGRHWQATPKRWQSESQPGLAEIRHGCRGDRWFEPDIGFPSEPGRGPGQIPGLK